MILVDANLLIYASDRTSAQHARARTWLEDRFNEPGRVGLPWPSLLAFLRIVTNPRIYPRPLAPTDAWRRIEGWLALPGVWVPQPTDRHAEVLKQLVCGTGAAAALVPDAHLAALAIEHGLIVCSADADFARFPGVRWENPLLAG